MRGVGRLRYVLAGTETGVDEAQRIEPIESRRVVGHMVRLAPHRLLPGEAQPRQILEDGGLIGCAAAGAVDILDAQQKAAMGGAGRLVTDEGGGGVAEMQIAGRAGGEAGDNHAAPAMAGAVPIVKFVSIRGSPCRGLGAMLPAA